jgi:hypothetical protein
MKNIIFALIALLIGTMHCYSDEKTDKWIVVSNNVNVRDNPSVNSKVIKQISFPETINVYEIKGSGLIKNGILDKWAKIAPDNPEWINYYYITTFPFVVSADTEYNYDSEGESTYIIEGYYIRDGQTILRVKRNMNPYYHKDIEFEVAAAIVVRDAIIIDNPRTRLYNFCEGFSSYVEKIKPTKVRLKTIIDTDVLLDYGIQIGIDIGQVTKTFGNAYQQEGNIYHYEAFYVGAGYHLYFYTEGNTVTKIIHEIEK